MNQGSALPNILRDHNEVGFMSAHAQALALAFRMIFFRVLKVQGEPKPCILSFMAPVLPYSIMESTPRKYK